MRRTRVATTTAIAVLMLGSVQSLSAQQDPMTLPLDVHSRAATRAQLEARMSELQTQAMAMDDEEMAQQLRLDIQAAARRLQDGDIFEGDVISLAVSGELDWTNSFTITPRRTLDLDGIDPISVRGILYSELEGHLTTALGAYLRQPRVHAEALKRIAVLGGVGAPGFYSVSGSTIVADLIMTAGGPASTAQMDDAEFKRLGEDIGFDTGGPIAFQAYSLDQLGVRSGDELHVPVQGPQGRFWQDFRFIVLGITGVVFAVARIF